MKQLVQHVSGGPVRLVEVPKPVIGPTEVLVRTLASVVSPGTERALTSLAQSSLLAKARARPDLVRKVIRKARREGLAATARSVRARLDEDLPLGYSASGIALEVGEHVAGIVPGTVVSTGGAGKACHAEYQAVPGLLCVSVPQGVSVEDAAFATVGAIALHGLRLADVGPGAKVVVIGLGLIGQLATRLALASGCDVVGIDIAEPRLAAAREVGVTALAEAGDETTDHVLDWTRGRGADAVLLAAADDTAAVVTRTPPLCRDRATVVVVGDVGLRLDRTPFYERELTVRFARSYGPGRYEPSYEGWAVDYPAGYVRWTEGRNLEAVLDLLAARALRVSDLLTHRFEFDRSPDAYAMLRSGNEDSLGIQLTYPDEARPEPPAIRYRKPSAKAGEPGVGLIGAGAFARTVLLPAFKAVGFQRFVSVASASGLSAARTADAAGFEKAVSGPDAVIDDDDVDVVVIATPHDSHARLAARALRAGKHVWCEKPLALTLDELEDVEAALTESDQVLWVGFNRRFSPAVAAVREHFEAKPGPLVITYRVNAGSISQGHWYGDRRQGGRLLGEVGHFVDTCSAIVGADPLDVNAASSARSEVLLGPDFAVTLRYADGSLAVIVYAATGPPAVEKERIDVLGRGRSALIDDFRGVSLDGGKLLALRSDKGHEACARAFLKAPGEQVSPSWAIESSRATLGLELTLQC